MVMSFIVRTQGDPLALGPAVRARVGKVDVTAPVAAIRSVESYLDAGQTALLQFVSAILGMVALVALVIAVPGVYALTAHGVAGIAGRSWSCSAWPWPSSSARLRDWSSGTDSAASSRGFSRVSRSRHPTP